MQPATRWSKRTRQRRTFPRLPRTIARTIRLLLYRLHQSPIWQILRTLKCQRYRKARDREAALYFLRQECALPDRLGPFWEPFGGNWIFGEEILAPVINTMSRYASWQALWTLRGESWGKRTILECVRMILPTLLPISSEMKHRGN